MLTALSAKNKLEFIDGTATQPTKTDSTFLAWNRCNNMVVSWLVHFVFVPICQSIVCMDKAVEIWNDLKQDILKVTSHTSLTSKWRHPR